MSGSPRLKAYDGFAIGFGPYCGVRLEKAASSVNYERIKLQIADRSSVDRCNQWNARGCVSVVVLRDTYSGYQCDCSRRAQPTTTL